MILNQLNENDIRFFIGYSGWGSKQLDRELKEKSWVVSNAQAKELINVNPAKMWSRYIRSFGEDYAIWANFPQDVSLN